MNIKRFHYRYDHFHNRLLNPLRNKFFLKKIFSKRNAFYVVIIEKQKNYFFILKIKWGTIPFLY